MKRLIDYGCLLIAVVMFLPLALVIALFIWLDDKGPILFRQERVGQGKTFFEVFKFRTMRDGAITRVGRVLRQTGLDEIPQFLNVLKGDMSIVGPRPLTEFDVQRLGWAKHSDRWNVKPGITGLAQIYSGFGARHSLRLDRLYARAVHPLVDIKIISITLVMNFLGKRRVRRWLTKADATKRARPVPCG